MTNTASMGGGGAHTAVVEDDGQGGETVDGSRGPRMMPSMSSIIDYWCEHEEPWLKSRYIGWGEPFCFGCGWLPPVQDGRADSWVKAASWLDRAHLHDRVLGGPDDPSNLAPLCHLCHFDMPDSHSRESGMQWVKDREDCDVLWQFWTDEFLWGKRPARHTTLMRWRRRFLEVMAKVDAEIAARRTSLLQL